MERLDRVGITAVAFLADKLDIPTTELYEKLRSERKSMTAMLLASMWEVDKVFRELEEAVENETRE